jgi:hypothetical protein
MDGYDVRQELLSCEMIPASIRQAISEVQPRDDTPGLSFVVRNLIEPDRWDTFAQRQLEQDIYPLLSSEDGDFEIHIMRNPPAPLRLSIPINSMILDGSRWESEMEAAAQDGYQLDGVWQRSDGAADGDVRLSGIEWMVWAALAKPSTISDVARRLCMPDLATIGAIKRLRSLALVHEGD